MQRVILVILFTFWAFMTYRLWQVEYAAKASVRPGYPSSLGKNPQRSGRSQIAGSG